MEYTIEDLNRLICMTQMRIEDEEDMLCFYYEKLAELEGTQE